MRAALISSAVSSHLSDHPEHPHGHVIEEERPPPLHRPSLHALLEDDGPAVDAADRRRGSFSVYSVFGSGSFSMDGSQAGTSGGRVPLLPPSLGPLAAL